MNGNKLRTAALTALMSTCFALPAFSQETANKEDFVEHARDYSPYVDQHFPNRVFWGDTHLHTSYSTDAGMIGCRLGPDEAYRLAHGEEVRSSDGLRVRLSRPYDFLVVSDHAENLGLAPMIASSDPILLKTEVGKLWHDMVKGVKASRRSATGLHAAAPRARTRSTAPR